MKKYTKFVGLNIPEDLFNQLEELADAHRVNKSICMRIALEMYIESMKDVKPIGGK